MNLRDRLDLVAADLGKVNLPFVLDLTSEDKYDAWDNATAAHGEHVASASVPGGHWTRDAELRHRNYSRVEWLDVSFPYASARIGRLIADTFRLHGFHIDWNGRADRAVSVRLDPS